MNDYISTDLVSEIMDSFEALALNPADLNSVAIDAVEASVDSSHVSHSSVGVPFARSQGGVSDNVTREILRVAVDFLGVNPSIMAPSTPLISLGLDSIKAVGLAKRINKLGYKVTSTDVLRAASIDRLAQVIGAKPSQADQNSGAGDGAYDAMKRKILDKVDINSLKLCPDDEPAVHPATALQSGMLSQVSPLVYPFLFKRCLTSYYADHRFQRRTVCEHVRHRPPSEDKCCSTTLCMDGGTGHVLDPEDNLLLPS